MKKQITPKLKAWHKANPRPMPWLEEKDPYKIWISEIILQQTRVKQGWKYYERFVETFPNVDSLANAPIDEVMKLWEGLGYYSRARNLHHAAKEIQSNWLSQFPHTYEDIHKLKGVGPYTAAAIASFAYNLPYAVVDGNVKRVFARLYGITEVKGTTNFNTQVQELAEIHLDRKKPGSYNQAIINFGAIQCLPKNPKCTLCTLNEQCAGFAQGIASELPRKPTKKERPKRYMHYLYVTDGTSILIRLRKGKDIWRMLYDLPEVEGKEEAIPPTGLKSLLKRQLGPVKVTIEKPSGPYNQMLTHRHIIAYFYKIGVKSMKNVQLREGLVRIPKGDVDKYAKPKVIDMFLKDKSLYLF